MTIKLKDMACQVVGCKSEKTPKKYTFCRNHWDQIPNELRLRVREGTSKGLHTLRAHPTKEWLEKVSDKLGVRVRIPVTLGFGVHAIKKSSVKEAQESVA